VGPKKTLFLDEISTGLDSSTTFQITRTLREFSHLRAATMLVALLQPTPETYNLFDDIMLLSEGMHHPISSLFTDLKQLAACHVSHMRCLS
jgi:ABC-type multidrug transport system ATPase subunit